MTTVIHKTPDFIGVPLYTLKCGDCFKLEEYNDNHLYMKIEVPDNFLRWAQIYISGEVAQCAIDLDAPDQELLWLKPGKMVKPIDVEIKEL